MLQPPSVLYWLHPAAFASEVDAVHYAPFAAVHITHKLQSHKKVVYKVMHCTADINACCALKTAHWLLQQAAHSGCAQ